MSLDPGILHGLLVAKRDSAALAVELEDLDVDVVPHLEHLARMRDAPPRHVRHMEQAIDAAQDR